MIPIGIPWVKATFMIKLHKLQNIFLILFFIIVHILGAHYHYAKFDIDLLLNKTIKFANNLDLQT